ncbi:hypothetical protein MQE36_00175 [Zhouia spongiae]|uniref:DUF3800 domain-containing protein n=1 Tax=Zhouia spongiae TaxID=2202721 RepID=A0ABY3YLS7_9FLAO|nr:hypothetical protein [Zhouia spongiae]UNY98787.1 hypothetical protein MQE36_00175 [Zhouia spongiae]
MKKTNYFYIDEAGHVNNDSAIFLYGCIKTDTPSTLEKSIEELKSSIIEEVYYEDFRKSLIERNFHAVDDHFDIRAEMYKILPYLNFRGYFVVTNKMSSYFKNLKKEKEDYEIIDLMLRKLIKPRVSKNREDKNCFIFETLEVEKKSLKNILDELFSGLSKKYDVEYEIVGKENVNMAVIDYVNYNLYSVLNPNDKPQKRTLQNFEILKDKIALINVLDDNSFYSRKGDLEHLVEIKNIRNKMAGDRG